MKCSPTIVAMAVKIRWTGPNQRRYPPSISQATYRIQKAEDDALSILRVDPGARACGPAPTFLWILGRADPALPSPSRPDTQPEVWERNIERRLAWNWRLRLMTVAQSQCHLASDPMRDRERNEDVPHRIKVLSFKLSVASIVPAAPLPSIGETAVTTMHRMEAGSAILSASARPDGLLSRKCRWSWPAQRRLGTATPKADH
ncbi:hypothetical protein K438DRAFT_1750305 [Mycena galopus ATCC 62051]|nr:hypothetical protein K438DRAFT_1750305 [Mycena galopus ATCC 62051]